MDRVFVSGDRGFIGSNLRQLLEKRGFEVKSFDLLGASVKNSQETLDYINDALTQHKPKGVFHVGACSNTLETDVNRMFFRNYEITKCFVDWSVENNTPIVYSSSAANFGVNGIHPSNLYGWSKYAAEDYVRKSGGVSLRYFNVYGPGEDHKGSMASFVNQAFRNHLHRRRIKLFPGAPIRDFVHVEDVCEANLYAFVNYSRLNLGGGLFEVGSSQPHSFEEALEAFGLSWEYLPESDVPAGYQMFTEASQDNFIPGWKPRVEFHAGMNSYREHLERRLRG
jgi:ADP-L-glycero-D-manno-heptose 6-epimerase